MPDLEHDSAPLGELIEALSLAKIGAPYRHYPGTGGIYMQHNDGFPDAEFRDWGLARAVSIIVNNADLITAALRSQSPEPSSSEVRVKPLEWRKHKGDDFCYEHHDADALGGSYVIEARTNGRFDLWIPNQPVGEAFMTLTSAKAAAQADYEQRIRSALSPTVSQPGTGEEVDRAMRGGMDCNWPECGCDFDSKCSDAPGETEVQRLRARIRQLEIDLRVARTDITDTYRPRAERAEARLSAVEGALEKAIEALKPFAFQGLRVDLERFDDETKIEVHFPRTGPSKAIPAGWVYVEDVLAAREALTTTTGGENER